MKRFLFLISSIIISETIAQKNDYIWLFGYRSELIDSNLGYGGFDFDFNQNPFQIKKHSREMHLTGADASYCDKDGNLKLYANECFMANQFDRRVKGGDSLFNYSRIKGGNCYLGEPVSGNSIFLPDFSSSKIVHYLMLVDRGLRLPIDSIDGITYDKYLLHSKIDLDSNNNEAEVIISNRVILEDTFALYGLKSCKHVDKKSWWIILKKLMSHQFVRILVNEDTIYQVGIQSMGNYKNYNFYGSGNGTSAFSPDGKKYAWYDPYNDLNIYDFDRSTGLLSNYRKIVIQDSLTGGGLAFSPNSKFAYTTSLYDLYQIDLEEKDTSRIIEHISHYSGNLCPISKTSSAYYNLLLGPDCRIYMNTPGSVTCMHVINSPDRKGKACNFVEQGIMLPYRNGINIPNFPHYRIDNTYPCDSNIRTRILDIPSDDIQANIYYYRQSEEIVILANWNQTNKPMIRLFDLLGRELLRKKLSTNLEEQHFTCSNLPNGLYIFQLNSGKARIASGKIFID
ncbi:MAG: T9SS type A sorting domain-containing protein [Saprospiraceae bacterium]